MHFNNRYLTKIEDFMYELENEILPNYFQNEKLNYDLSLKKTKEFIYFFNQEIDKQKEDLENQVSDLEEEKEDLENEISSLKSTIIEMNE